MVGILVVNDTVLNWHVFVTLQFCLFKVYLKTKGSTEIWTRISRFKVWSANHYTIEPVENDTKLIELIELELKSRSCYALAAKIFIQVYLVV